MKRKATAVWNGDIKTGAGHITTGVPYSTKHNTRSTAALPTASAPTRKSSSLLPTRGVSR